MFIHLKVLIFILFSQLAGIVGGFFTSSSVGGWYQTLAQPSFNPPGWVFGPVWIVLYTLMGVSSYLVWLKVGINSLAKPALIIFYIHLVLNALWSILFFGLKNPFLAFIEIIILLVMILIIIVLFYRIDKTASYLLIPYLLWVSFASILNFFIWRLN